MRFSKDLDSLQQTFLSVTAYLFVERRGLAQDRRAAAAESLFSATRDANSCDARYGLDSPLYRGRTKGLRLS
jgi:hypothetical protein